MTISDLRGHTGEEIAVSDWIDVTQAHIDRFAEATGDRQWIHTDPVRAAEESPFKTTIAHGFLTLSLSSVLLRSALSLDGVRMAINYGCNRVRFVSAVPAGSRLRARVTALSVEDVENGRAVQIAWSIVIEREGSAKPACIAEWLVRYYPSPTP